MTITNLPFTPTREDVIARRELLASYAVGREEVPSYEGLYYKAKPEVYGQDSRVFVAPDGSRIEVTKPRAGGTIVTELTAEDVANYRAWAVEVTKAIGSPSDRAGH